MRSRSWYAGGGHAAPPLPRWLAIEFETTDNRQENAPAPWVGRHAGLWKTLTLLSLALTVSVVNDLGRRFSFDGIDLPGWGRLEQGRYNEAWGRLDVPSICSQTSPPDRNRFYHPRRQSGTL